MSNNLEPIISRSIEMFMTRGIKAVSMDDISRELGMSKRTLYEAFSSKDELLCACIKYHEVRLRKALEEIRDSSKDSMEMIVRVMFYFLNLMKHVNPAFIEEVHHVQFQSSREVFEEQERVRREGFCNFIAQGKEEGYIRKEIDAEIVAMLVTNNNDRTWKLRISEGMQRVFENFYLILFRGMATPKGVQRIDELIEEYKNNNII